MFDIILTVSGFSLGIGLGLYAFIWIIKQSNRDME